jgi:hypothetical protein
MTQEIRVRIGMNYRSPKLVLNYNPKKSENRL